jgi:hypothetical protein
MDIRQTLHYLDEIRTDDLLGNVVTGIFSKSCLPAPSDAKEVIGK